ncbi:MAG: ATP-binding cassette domain-containing protein [Pseudomonadales bacterium]|nr:ATP-binding cassette domain-containing protein [Pseudomonadales bacterium]NRA17148.1 ATP-binding cassette domain-containing protein [Oceanospirillaceae bacterium]
MYLTVTNATKHYGSFRALNDVSISIEKGEFVCLLGPSGCGKTSLLRIIAGLADLDEGDVQLNGKSLLKISARKRDFGIVFQSYSLFPNMTVAENIGYGLKIRKIPADQISARVSELLDIIKLPQFADKIPGQLSGGQQQRVALARAIAVNPRVLLLDEPLSALDAQVRGELRDEIHQLQRSLGIPTLMVTHDQEEALALADKIICMNQGVVVQSGTPHELYHKPATRFVATFMGTSNLISTQKIKSIMPELLSTRPGGDDDQYDACIRPESIRIEANPKGEASIVSIGFLGNLSKIKLASPLGNLIVEVHGATDLKEKQKVSLDIAPADCIWVENDVAGIAE